MSGRKPTPVTVTLSRYEADILYQVATRAEDDNRYTDGGRQRRALGRALDKLALARRDADFLDDLLDGAKAADRV